MSQEIYQALVARLNQFQTKIPPLESYLDLIKEIYTVEEAALGTAFPPGFHTLETLAERLNRDETELKNLLEIMARKGTIFTTKDREYAMQAFVPGVVEFQLMRSTDDTPRHKKIAGMISKFEEETRALARTILEEHPEILAAMPNPNFGRTITINEALPRDSEVSPHEDLLRLLEDEDSFALAPCYCQNQKRLEGKPCKVEDGPSPRCITVGKSADYVAEQGFGERIGKEKAMKVLAEAEGAGLIHNISNINGRVEFICNCCACCCPFLSSIREMKDSGITAYSNFLVSVDEGGCTGCEECIERCQMEAFHSKDDVVEVDQALCVGCGNCVSACPVDALSMKRRSTQKPLEIEDERIVALGGIADPF